MKKVTVIYPEKIGTVAPEIYGHFSEHIGGVFYDGLWVGKDSEIPNIRGFRKDLVEKLKAIHPPVLRWPGGCYAETYNWRDGIGELELFLAALCSFFSPCSCLGFASCFDF